MKMKKVLSLIMAGAMVLGTMSMSAFAEETEAASEATTEAGSTAAADTTGGTTPLVVGSQNFSEKFSAFFAESVPDQTIVNLTNLYLIENDRSGSIIYNGANPEGETIAYNGTDYTYHTLANVTVTENEDNTVYNLKLRDDVVFSDGTPLTADDVIFSMYVYSDMDYDGYATFSGTPIKGLQNYRLNSTVADSITDEDVAAALTEMPEGLAASVKEAMKELLDSEYNWADAAWEDYSADYGVNSGAEFFALLYGPEDYSVEGKDRETIVNDVLENYGTDYATLAAAYGDEAYFDETVAELAKEYLVAEKTAAGEGEEVPNIEGIKKLGDYEIEVTTDGFDATTIYQLGLIVSPLSYYGDPALYDYDNNQFGFTRGDLSAVREKTAKPMGAGAYKFVKYENKTVYLEANENYYKGEPKIKNMQLRESADADFIPGVEQGTIDLADPTGSKSAFEQIKSINSNGELDGDRINTSLVDNLGYGYIGMNANNVCVGDEPGSDASKNLRKAIATVLAVYRDVTIDSYYGDAAAVINYPISNTSWAAPQKSDADYEVAFSKDVEGNPIYTDEMTDDEKFAAALEAAKGFFAAAGYTFGDDGKMTAAPAGAKLSYEVMIGAAGTGDHPSFAILTDAKAALATIGFDLEINDITDSNIMWDANNAGTSELWCAAWQATLDPDMVQIYHSTKGSSNHYRIADETLDADIMDARSTADQAYRKSVYKQCLDIIMDWAVEIPVYQRQNCVIYSTERINADTFTPDVTTYYNWYADVENMEMN